MVTVKERNHKMTEKLMEAKKKRQPLPLKPPSGTFFCDGHLDFLPLKKQSRDGRYCHECLTTITGAANSTGDTTGDYWVPGKGIFITGGKAYGLTADLRTVCQATPTATLPTDKALQKQQPPLDTPHQKERESKPTRGLTQKVLQKPKLPVGRPRKTLPVKKIKKLHDQGLGTRAIAQLLSTDKDTVSHVTIHRIIQGQMEMPIEGS